MMRQTRALVLGVVMMALTACGGGAKHDPLTLTMGNSAFIGNATITITVGQAITFDDPALNGNTHLITTGQDGKHVSAPGVPAALDSPNGLTFVQGDKRSFTFTTPGTYHFFCLIHQSMIATITVTP